MGKSIISKELEQLAATSTTTSSSSSPAATTTFKLLSGDAKAKCGVKGMRYWGEVAAAADGHLGGGHRVMVVADKNLVPAPAGNIQQVRGVLARSGEWRIGVRGGHIVVSFHESP